MGISSTRDTAKRMPRLQKSTGQGKKLPFTPVKKMRQMLMRLSPLTLTFSSIALTPQKNSSGYVRTGRFRLQFVPRSNWMLGVNIVSTSPPTSDLCRIWGARILRTDNVMFVSPDMFSEMAFTSVVYRMDPKVLVSCSCSGVLNMTGNSFFIRKGVRANLFTIDPAQSSLHFSRDPLTSLVKRASVSQIGNNVFNW